jgi:helix-turn-helix protein
VSEKSSLALAAVPNGTLSATDSLTAAAGATNAAAVAEYLLPAQAAALLQVHEKTLSRWSARDATLPVLKLGGTVRYPHARFLKWLRDHEQGRNPGRQPSGKRVLSSPNVAPPKESA